jgi:cytochrome c peroxidase
MALAARYGRFDSVTIGILTLAGALAACSGADPSDGVGIARQGIFQEEPGPFPREGECNLADPAFDSIRPRLGGDHNTGPDTLKGQPIPEPSNLKDYVRSRRTAIALGKALFWDMQVGSDGIQSCGTCHFRAGADPRSRNMIQPGGANNPDTSFDHPPNLQLSSDMYPFTKFADPQERSSTLLRDSDDVTSSQGVFLSNFVNVVRGAERDITQSVPDPVFNVGGINTRRNEPRNTPTVINAVFNHRQFWDGRAQATFNGVNPFGVRDPNAKVLRSDGHTPTWTVIRIDSASLASQAVGPPLSDREMGSIGRTFQDVGRRLVSAKPLRLQTVHRQDSVLGIMADRHGDQRGLDTTYEELIEQAFDDSWWKSDKIVVKDTTTGATSFAPYPHHRELRDNEYTMMEWNFSLFFGLAIQLYETTLIADDTKMDQHFDRVNRGKPGLLNEHELHGLDLFAKAGCKDCHTGPHLSSAVTRTLVTGFENPTQNPSFQPPEVIERMVLGTCQVAVYDQSFYNLGVRPTDEDLGIGGDDPFGNPLSIAKILTANPATIPSQELLTQSYPNLMSMGRIPPLEPGERTSVQGAFKMPQLRNVALTAPYFHNGGKRTLREVVELYNRGGDFHDHVGADGVPQTRFMDLGIGRLHLTESEIDDIVSFLESLTDQRVADQVAPFDHPELFVPNGHLGDTHHVLHIGNQAITNLMRVPEVGKHGGKLPKGFLE